MYVLQSICQYELQSKIQFEIQLENKCQLCVVNSPYSDEQISFNASNIFLKFASELNKQISKLDGVDPVDN